MWLTTEYTLLPNQYKFCYGFDKSKLNMVDEEGRPKIYQDISLYQGGMTCKKASAEYLTPSGWRTMDTLTKDTLMAVYYPEDNTIKFEYPKEVFIWNADKWYELDSRSIHQINCPNHRMYTIKDGNPHIQSMTEYYEEHQKSKNGHRGKFITTFKVDGNDLGSDADIKLAVAFQADGYFSNQKKYPFMFHLKKTRKRDRLIELFKKTNTEYFCREEANGYFRLGCSKIKYAFKEYPIEWYTVNSRCLSVIAQEAPLWDGSIEKTNFSYYTSKKRNADFIQFAASASGYKATIFARTRKYKILNQGKVADKTEYRVKYQNKNTTPSYAATHNKNEIKVYDAEIGEKKYCPSTSTKLWLCREFGRITVTGNSGKTFIGSLRGLLFALQWPGCRGLVGAKSQDLLDNTTKRKYLDHMEIIGLKEGVHWWYSDRKNTINFCNGSTIRFRTLSDWQQFMSEEFTWIEFEEASFLEEIIFIKLITRLRQQKKPEWKGYYRALFMHTNPQGRRGWLYKHFINPKTKKPSYRYVCASTRENHHLGEEYVEMLEELYSAEQVAEMIEGLDVDTDNTIAFPNFTQGNLIDKLSYDRGYPLILTCDFNYNPMCWYLMQKRGDEWYVLRELIAQNITTKDMCSLVLPVIAEYGTRKLIIMGDSHGRDKKTNGSDYSVMLQFFSQRGFDCTLLVQKANPRIIERLALLRGFICNAKGRRKLFVDSSCKRLIYNFEENKNNLTTGGLKEPTDKEIQEDINKLFLIHPIDAISYPIYYVQRYEDTGGVFK